jgi:DNA-binding transcriptional MerR regulator
MEGRASKPSKKVDGYIRKEASAITQIPARTIQYYTDRGFVTPDVAAPTGRGTTRRYSLKNLVELSIVKELTTHGLTLNKIEEIMRVVRGGLDRYWNKPNDIAGDTDLSLILLHPHTKSMETQLCRTEDIDLPGLIRIPSFSVIGFSGVILRVLDAAIGTSKVEAYFKLLGRFKYSGYPDDEEIARILDEGEEDEVDKT